MTSSKTNLNIAVIIPCYKVKNHVLDVIEKIPHHIVKIYAVDDACPDVAVRT